MRFKILTMFAAALIVSACAGDYSDTGAVSSGGSSADNSAVSGSPSSAVSSSEIKGPQPGTQDALLVDVGDRVFYATDSSSLSAEARKTVGVLAMWLNSNPSVTLALEGHADERGTREYNLALGERRANAVRDYLIDLGVNVNRLQTISFGKERPAILGSNEAAWSQNRRAVFSVN